MNQPMHETQSARVTEEKRGHSPGEIHSSDASGEQDQRHPDFQAFRVLLADLREIFRRRQDHLKAEVAAQNRVCAIIRRYTDCPKSGAPKIAKRIFSTNGDQEAMIEGLPRSEWLALCWMFEDDRKRHKAERKAHEKKLEPLVEQLPVWDYWAKDVRGFGSLGLALIVGAAGDLGNYANPAKLWKRFGVGLVDEGFGSVRQGRRTDEAEAALHAYSPARRAMLWNQGESLVKLNKDYFRQVYDDRKIYERDRHDCLDKERCGWCHNRAKRYMEKRLLRELWKAWRRANKAAIG